MNPQEKQSTKEEIRENKRRCWWTTCKRTAYFEDWCGSHWCWYHAYYSGRWSGGSKWYNFKTLKFRNPFNLKKL